MRIYELCRESGLEGGVDCLLFLSRRTCKQARGQVSKHVSDEGLVGKHGAFVFPMRGRAE